MENIQRRITVEYKVCDSNGEVIDQSQEPFEFTVGQEEVLPAFEEAALKMENGESRTVAVPCSQAHGNRNDDLIRQISKEQIPPHLKIEEGMFLQLGEDKDPMIVKVIAITDDAVVIDGNHPLAGTDLVITITKIQDNQTKS